MTTGTPTPAGVNDLFSTHGGLLREVNSFGESLGIPTPRVNPKASSVPIGDAGVNVKQAATGWVIPEAIQNNSVAKSAPFLQTYWKHILLTIVVMLTVYFLYRWFSGKSSCNSKHKDSTSDRPQAMRRPPRFATSSGVHAGVDEEEFESDRNYTKF